MVMLIKYIRDLNIFKSKDDTNRNEYQYYSNILATRVYIITFLLILVGILIGLWLTLEARRITLYNPSEDQFNKLPHEAQCPCSQLSFSLGTFVTVEAKFHQICSSDFVTDRWIKILFFGSNASKFYQSDIRSIGSAQFQSLASFCRLSEKHFYDGLNSLYSTPFISSEAFYKNLLESTIQGLIKEFELTVPFIFKSQLQLINQMIYANQLVPALETTSDLYFYDQLVDDYNEVSTTGRVFTFPNDSDCNCQDDYNCGEESGIYFLNITNTTMPRYIPILLKKVPGFFAGCTPINSLLQSTFECFYNQTCLNQILLYISNKKNFTAMSTYKKSQFEINSTVQTIVDRIMLEELTYNISYEKYFNQCKPNICTYLKVERHKFIYIITKIIGLLGGLTLALGILIPLVIHFIRNRKLRNNENNPDTNICNKLIQLKVRIKDALVKLNLFKTTSNNNRYINSERKITRFYILILIISFIIIIIYLLSTKDIYQETIIDPNESTYNKLKEIYSNNLICPCNKLSRSYENFISITPIYHEICSSDFISSDWINFMKLFSTYTEISDYQYQINLVAQFNILETFCKSVQQTVNDALRVFLQTQYISSQIIDQKIFEVQINLLIDNWKLNTQNRYKRVIQLIQETNQGNKLINNLYSINFLNNLTINEMYYISLNYSNCSCDLFGSCIAPMYYRTANPNLFSSVSYLNIPNFFMGCFPVQALLQSKLECFANQTCLDHIIKTGLTILLSYDSRTNFTILNITDKQRNETIESIVNQLMVNSWISNISFSSYYNSCAPTCTYEYTSYRHILIVISTFIGVFGGLSKGLKIFILIIMKFIIEIMKINSFHSVIQIIKNIFIINNDQTKRNRIHFILLIITLIILYLISFLTLQMKIIEIKKPSLSIYENLFIEYSDSLECTCSKISFEYETFLNIKPEFHQICSSHFMSNDWIMYIYNQSRDFNNIIFPQYQLLISFCQLSQETIENALLQLIKTDFINTKLISYDSLNEKIHIIINDFELRTAKSFINTLDLIREMTSNNMLMTIYSTNWKYNSVKINDRYLDYQTIPIFYNDCDCGISSKCTQLLEDKIIGCYPLEALLQSTLQCFYNQQCIDSETFNALNFSSNSSQFNLNSTVKFILEKLMVEEYLINISYDKYFEQCSISSCTYSFNGYGDTIDIAVLLFELYGGLTIISQWITLVIMKLYSYRQRQIQPEIH